MTKLNLIQQKIKELDGGAFQNLFNSYLFRKYKFKNIHTIGSCDGTNKPTKGVPDTYIINNDKTYTLIMYGTTQYNPYKKLKNDILSCLNKKKLNIEKDKIKKIICGYCSSNLTLEQVESLEKITAKIELILIDLGSISYDLCYNYQNLAFESLGIPIDTMQIFSPKEFIKAYDNSTIGSPLNIEKFMFRENELEEIIQSVLNNKSTLILGASGIGKTRLVLEALKADDFKEYTILCVKNNGAILSSDINTYISTSGKYILFLDDANQTTSFEYILNFINNPPKNIEIKLIMTVRDYAKEKILNILYKQIETNIIKIEKFNNDEIEEILKNNLGIVNSTYLHRITEISKGNIRIAIITGKIALKGKLNAIKNVLDVFKNYYDGILLKEEISQIESYTLFAISFFKAIHIHQNKFLPEFLNIFNISKNDFVQACIDLHQKELIDLYDNKFAKISDQSLGDYILYYILIERKMISITDLFKLVFPSAKDAIINTISTILKLFYSDETYNYIKKQVIESWHYAKEDEKEQYLKSFYCFNQDETLLHIKKEINKIPYKQFDLSTVDIKDCFRNHHFKTYLPEILSGLKYSNNYLNAIELLLELASKNLECALDACYVFCNIFSYDKNSSSYKFEKEFLLIKTILKHYNKTENPNLAIMLIEVLKELLKGEDMKTEPGENIRSILFTTIYIPLSDNVKKLRAFIWQTLAKLYKICNYKEKIEKFIYNYNNNISDKKTKAEFIQYDMECFEREFKPYFKEISFVQAIILEKLESNYCWLDVKPTYFLSKYSENKDFCLIKLFIEDNFKNENWREAQNIKEQKIGEMIANYNIDDFKYLFRVCKKYEKFGLHNSHLVGNGLYIIFKKLEEKPEIYAKIVKAYLEKFPYFQQISKIIIYNLIKFIGKDETENIIKNTSGMLNSFLFCNFYELFPNNLINDNVCNELENFIKKEVLSEFPRIINVFTLEKYKIKNPSIVNKITKIIINSDNHIELIKDYLYFYIGKDEIQKLIKIFDSDESLLEEIYFLQLENFVDFQHLLFDELMKNNSVFWNKFIIKLTNLKEIPSKLNDIFDKIWQKDNYKKYIDTAVANILIKNNFNIYKHNNIVSLIFRNSQNTNEIMKNNKQNWIKNFIIENIENVENLKIIFEIIVDCFAQDKIEYFKLFLKNSIDFEIFKQIPLFTWSYSWSGSEIPVIDERIKFLNNLLNFTQGIDFIEHKSYINKKIEHYNKRKEEAEQREYIENYY